MPATHSLSLTAASSQYATISDGSSSNLDITGSQTWECWVNLTTVTAQQHYLGGIRASGGGSLKGLWFGTTPEVNFSLSGLSTNETVSATLVSGFANNWNHIAGVYDGSTLKMYINGELAKSVTATGTSATITAGFSIGRLGDQAVNYTNGRIRNFRVWNVARTQQEIRDNMNIDTPSGTGLQGNWILNNAYTDSSGNGYTLTASGSPVFSTTYPDAINLTENGAFTKKHKINVQASQVPGSTDLTDVPIVLTESNFFSSVFDNTINGGADLRFSTDVLGKTRLAHEVVSWDTAGKTGEVWVKANTLGATTNTPIYVHYKNPTASALDENEAFGKHQVWGENWEGVWHLEEASGTRMDSSKNSNNLTDNNTVTSATGKIKTAADFEVTNSEHLNVLNNLSIGGGNVTIFAWTKFESFQGNNLTRPAVVSLYDNTAKVDYRIYSYLNTNGYVGVARHKPNVAWDATTEEILLTDTWYHLVLKYSGTTLSYLRDGVQKYTATVSGSGTGNYTTSFALGAGNAAVGYHDGLIDNAMVYNGALSDDYITTLYNNQNNPATFAIPQSTAGGAFLLQFV